MTEPYIIQLDRLKNGTVQKIDTLFAPDFFEIEEEDLDFKDGVCVSGEAYLAEDELVLHLSASTVALLPCSVCNKMTPVQLAVKGFYHAEALTEIRGVTFDFRPILREALLVELPHVAECNGRCKERETLGPFLRKEPKKDDGPETYFPFTDLKLPRS